MLLTVKKSSDLFNKEKMGKREGRDGKEREEMGKRGGKEAVSGIRFTVYRY